MHFVLAETCFSKINTQVFSNTFVNGSVLMISVWFIPAVESVCVCVCVCVWGGGGVCVCGVCVMWCGVCVV